MKIKRFFAKEMREAIRQVKDELGADAVILSNNKVDGGIELVAAIDYDEDAVHRSLNGQADTRQQAFKHQQSSEQPRPQQQQRAVIKKKKRSVFAKIKKQKDQADLADSIQDDVISFSHSPKQDKNQMNSPARESQTNSFAEFFKQSSSKQAAGNSFADNQPVPDRSAKAEQDAYSKPSMQDRKQPFISDFDDLNDMQNNETSEQNSYPFDYESLVKEEQKSAQNLQNQQQDDFFSTTKQQQRTTNRQKNRNKQSEKIEWVQDPALTSMQEELKSMRGILENQLSGLAWGSFARNHPHHAELLSRLYRLGIKSSLSEKIVKQLKTSDSDSLEDSWRRVLSIIAKNIPMMKQDLIDEGGIVALVGPTGVGKTTNIAKLAARFTLKYGAKNLALVTTDSYRVGAHEQLKTYGRILGVPVYIANDEGELKQVLSRLDDKKLVLIDTAGMSHRDLRLAQQLTMLRHSHEKIKILVVLSASSQTLAMDEVIKTFNPRELDGCIASKVDESTSIGGIISILIENQLQLNYISDGQKVPEDIYRANTTDLLKQALEMVRQHPVSVNSDELAMSYSGGGLAHAVG